jgi:hypothetical protein
VVSIVWMNHRFDRASIALQYGAPLETICAALKKDHDGSPATAIGGPECD